MAQSVMVRAGEKVPAPRRGAWTLAGERIFQVPPLPLPEIVTSEALMADCPSVQLFLERAEAANPAFELTTSNAASVQQIVRRLDGIPLAIELAASRVKLLQPSEIASRLEESFKLLTGGPSNVLPHHQTLERAIDWSYDNLEPDQQSLFSQLSVFRGGFTLPACGAVMGAENEFDALDALGELVDKSLVRTDSLLEETRYYMLEPLREYAADRITSEERVQVDGRHANYFLELAERASPELRGPQQVEWLEHLETEHDNIRASLAWGLAAGESDLVQRTSAALSWFWLIRRHSTEAMDWFERALAMEGGSSGSRAWLLIQSGFVGSVIYHDELDRCLAAIIEGRDQFANLGDGQGLLTAQAYEAVLMWSKRDLESSNRLFSDVQQTAEAIEFGWLIGFCDFFLGVNAWYLGKMELAVDHYNRSLDLFRSSSDTTMTAWLLSRMANVSLGSKDLAGATTVLEECMSLMEQVGDRHGIGAAFLGLGISAHLSGDADEAQSLLGEAQTHLREGGGGQGLSWPLSNVYINTSTHEAIFEVTERYQASLSLPTDEWAKMVIDDAESLDKLNRPN
ncbi:MAG: hypothetical protein H8E48_10430 [Chloroflexi bacterium]|nr:hypothetical protein [Chloroflexota bacterium]